jgi:DNA repair exonuclease SbcCD ATPase subunit
MTEVIQRTPHTIATEIYSIKGQARSVLVLSSIEIGRRLVEAKEMLDHGEWGKWLEESVEYSKSTANNLMQIYREYGENSGKFPSIGDLSYTKAVALLGVPAEEREQFVQENDVENMSAREIQKIIKEKQKLEKELEKSTSAAEKEKAKLQKNISTLEKQLENAKANEVDAAEMDLLQKDLTEYQKRIKQLEADLKATPLEVSTVEVVPEAIEKELTELRKKVAQQGDLASVNFRLRFETLVDGFKHLLEALYEVPEAEREKFKKAVSGLILKMGERL